MMLLPFKSSRIEPFYPSSGRARARTRGARVVACAGAVLTAALGLAAPASAEPTSDYCRKVTARAEADAALLYAPTLQGQVVRFPQNGVADATGTVVGRGLQPRAAVSTSLVDIYRGTRVMEVAKADCRRQETAAQLQEALAQGLDLGRATALDTKLAYLRSKDPEVREAVNRAQERLDAHVSTFLEVHQLRRKALDITLKTADTERELTALRERRLREPSVALDELSAAYVDRSTAQEREASHLRKIQPWNLRLTGGVSVDPGADVFGVAELSYNVGGLFQGPAERRSVEAFKDELERARYEVRFQIESLLATLRKSAEHGERTVAALDVELARLDRERASMETSEAPNKAHVVASLLFERIDIEAERTYFAALAARHRHFGGRP